MIKIINLNKGIKNRKLITNFSYEFKNDLYLIKGPSGCGKTTFLKLLLGFDDKYSGIIAYNNQDIRQIPKQVLLNQICSFIPQESELIESLTIYENFMLFGKIQNSIDEEKIDYYLKYFNLENKKYDLAHTLSGGQKKRVSLIRSLLKNSEVLIADEPFSSLDEEYKVKVFNLFKTISKEKIVIVVNHDETALNSHSTKVIDFNKLEDYQIPISLDSYNINNGFTKQKAYSKINIKLILNNVKEFLSIYLVNFLILSLLIFTITFTNTINTISDIEIQIQEINNIPIDKLRVYEKESSLRMSMTSYQYLLDKYNGQITQAIRPPALSTMQVSKNGFIILNPNLDIGLNQVMISDYAIDVMVQRGHLEVKENYNDFIGDTFTFYTNHEVSFEIAGVRITNHQELKNLLDNEIDEQILEEHSDVFNLWEVTQETFNQIIEDYLDAAYQEGYTIQIGNINYTIKINDGLQLNEVIAPSNFPVNSFEYNDIIHHVVNYRTTNERFIEVSRITFEQMIFNNNYDFQRHLLINSDMAEEFLTNEDGYSVFLSLHYQMFTHVNRFTGSFRVFQVASIVFFYVVILLMLFNPGVDRKKNQKNVLNLKHQGASQLFIFNNYYLLNSVVYILAAIGAIISGLIFNNYLNSQANLIFKGYRNFMFYQFDNLNNIFFIIILGLITLSIDIYSLKRIYKTI